VLKYLETDKKAWGELTSQFFFESISEEKIAEVFTYKRPTRSVLSLSVVMRVTV
jgi:hypothetical protein